MSGRLYIFNGQKFTERERDVWRMLVESHPTKAIADDLGLSNKTVEWHRANIYKKLDVHDLAALTKAAIRHGLTTT